jgi:hypothetical protein
VRTHGGKLKVKAIMMTTAKYLIHKIFKYEM